MSDETTLEEIRDALDELSATVRGLLQIAGQWAETLQPVEPDIQRPLAAYPNFDWATIGARVLQADPDGATHVEWRGKIWTRRSPQNKFKKAIWYSRPTGTSESGTTYAKLITFKEIADAEPLPQALSGQVAVQRSQAQSGLANGAQAAGGGPTARRNGQASAPAPAPQPIPQGGAAKKPTGPLQPATQGAAPARKPTGPLAPSKPAGPLAYAEYAKRAARDLGLHPKMVDWIAGILGLDERAPDAAPALQMAVYFAHAKRLGLDREAAHAILQDTVMDVAQATRILVEQHTPPAPPEPEDEIPF
jgi:hypothetical protein